MGENSFIAAGTFFQNGGDYSDRSLVYNKRETTTRYILKNEV